MFAILVGGGVAFSTPARWRDLDRDVLQGQWRVIQVSGDAAQPLRGIVGHGTIRFVGDTIILRAVGNGDDSSDRFIFRLDTLFTPRRIDLASIASADEEAWSGSYRLVADTLRLALPIEHGGGRVFRPSTLADTNTLGLVLTRDPRHEGH